MTELTKKEILARCISSLNEEDVKLAMGYDLTKTEFDTDSSLLEFQGFNPVIIFNNLITLCRKDNKHLEKIKTLILFSLMRGFGGGKTWDAIYAKCSDEGAQKLKAAVNFFGVVLGKPTSKNTITFPRIMAAFPLLTFKINRHLLLSGKSRSIGAYGGKLPIEFQYAGSPAVMNSKTWHDLKDHYVEWSMYCSKVWKKPQKKDEAEKFAELAYFSVLVPEKLRLPQGDEE